MFFNLLLAPRPGAAAIRDGALGNYSHAFWLEHDTRPVRPGWADALLADTAPGGGGPAFWMKGSQYVGGASFDGTVLQPDSWGWVGHINGAQRGGWAGRERVSRPRAAVMLLLTHSHCLQCADARVCALAGNALYALHEPDFATFLALVVEREPPSHFW
jgi:hypothetical protein